MPLVSPVLESWRKRLMSHVFPEPVTSVMIATILSVFRLQDLSYYLQYAIKYNDELKKATSLDVT